MGFNDNETNVFRVERNGHRKYFLTRVDIKGYNVLTDGRNFYDQPISDELKKYEALRKIMSGNEDYTTESSIHYAYYKDHYKLVACKLCKRKILDSDPTAV